MAHYNRQQAAGTVVYPTEDYTEQTGIYHLHRVHVKNSKDKTGNDNGKPWTTKTAHHIPLYCTAEHNLFENRRKHRNCKGTQQRVRKPLELVGEHILKREPLYKNIQCEH